jgi:hypothetical protein
MSLTRKIKQLIEQAEATAKSDMRYELYTFIKDLQEKKVDNDIIVKEILAKLLGNNSRSEMLFDA